MDEGGAPLFNISAQQSLARPVEQPRDQRVQNRWI